MRFRLLPLLIVVAGLALVARLGDVWQGLGTVARAQTASEPAAPAEEPGGPGPNVVDQAAAVPAAGATGRPEDLPPDPLSMTDEEIDLLSALAERRRELDLHARELDQRETLLRAAERRIEEKAETLRALQRSIEDLLQRKEEETEAQYLSLVKIYENMKPKNAARIFEELDMTVLLPVVERMKERKTAPILARMDPVKAKAITQELAQRREAAAKDEDTD